MASSRAELYAGGQVLPVAAEDGQVLTVGRRGEHALEAAPPDVDLTDLPDGRTVSRRHAEMYVRDGRWYLRLQDTARNQTSVDGQVVRPGTEVALSDGSDLRLGKVGVSFRSVQLSRQEQVALTLEPARLTLAPGAVQEMVARLVNRTGYTERFCVRLEAKGIDPSWFTLTAVGNSADQGGPEGNCPEGAVQVRLFSAPAAVAAPPVESVGILRLVFHPPDDYTSRAGVYPFTLIATTDARPYFTQAVDGELTIESFAGLTLTLDEQRVHGWRGGVPFHVQNSGNGLAQVELRGDGDGLRFSAAVPGTRLITPPEGEDAPASLAARFALPPGESASGRFVASARTRHWRGIDRGYNFFVVAKAATVTPRGPLRKARPDAVEQRQLVQLVCPPRIPQWLQELWRSFHRMLAEAVMLALILGVAYVILHPPEVKDFSVSQETVLQGSKVTLHWQVSGGTSVTIEPGSISATPPPLVPPRPPAPNDLPPVKAAKTTWNGLTQTVDKIGRGIMGGDINGTRTLTPAQTTTFTLVARRALPVFPATRTITVDVQPQPKVASFAASTQQIPHEGEPVKLSWSWSGVTPSKIKLVSLAPDGGVVNEEIFGQGNHLESSTTVHPWFNDETYQVQLYGDDPATPTDSAQLQLTIGKPVIAVFNATPQQGAGSAQVDLQWQVQNATSVAVGQSPIDEQHPARDLSKLTDPNNQDTFGFSFASIPTGYEKWTYPLAGDTRFVLVARNQGGVSFKVIEVTAAGATPAKIDFFSASRVSGSATPLAQLSYSVENAKLVTITDAEGKTILSQPVSQPPNKPQTQNTLVVPAPSGAMTYALTVVGVSPADVAVANASIMAVPTPTPSATPKASVSPSATPAATPKS